MTPADILLQYGIRVPNEKIKPLGEGLINSTWKVEADQHREYVLQRVNNKVFKEPRHIAHNLEQLKRYVAQTEPGYKFVAPLPTVGGASLVETDGEFYRLFPYVTGCRTFTAVSHVDHAYEAALQFGKFAQVFAEFDPSKLKTTIPDFHNLEMRFNQFVQARHEDREKRSMLTNTEIEFLLNEQHLVKTYRKIVGTLEFRRRVTHHDTKISNVLFDQHGKGLCVIDLDTTMPGLFISDVGDMLRTYLAEAGEEERDLTHIEVRPEYFEAVSEGYLSQMGAHLSEEERGQFIYAGYYLIYMQALRFFTDYLNGDVYYNTTYDGQNLARARNQIRLFQSYGQFEADFRRLLARRRYY